MKNGTSTNDTKYAYIRNNKKIKSAVRSYRRYEGCTKKVVEDWTYVNLVFVERA